MQKSGISHGDTVVPWYITHGTWHISVCRDVTLVWWQCATMAHDMTLSQCRDVTPWYVSISGILNMWHWDKTNVWNIIVQWFGYIM